jgi:hypothetical protein
MINLTELKTLNVAIQYLKFHYEMTKPDDSGILMSSLIRFRDNLHPDLEDVIIWNDWQEAIKLFKKNKINDVFAESEAFEIFEHFLEKYYERTKSDDIGSFLSDLLHQGYFYCSTADPAAWLDWKKCLNKTKSEK